MRQKKITMNFIKANSLYIKKVLLVEDDPICQMATRVLLEKLGWEVSIADDGKSALNEQKKMFDLILLDINLPDMDGFEVAKKLREKEKSHENISRALIIAYTANPQVNKEKYLNVGFDDVISKPLILDKLKNITQRLSKKK